MVKLLDEAETLLNKRSNHRAVKTLDIVLAKLRGMDASTSQFRAQVTHMSAHTTTLPV